MQILILQSQSDVYQKEKLLGEGAFGKAYLVRKRQTGEYLVMKEMNMEHMSKQEREETIRQAQILRTFSHPNIVKFVQVYMTTKQNKLKIIMQYAECGDISKEIAARKKTKMYFEQEHILDWFTQICLAIKHVHDRKILHRDIKGQNIFITKKNTLKLGDFGIARILNRTMDKAKTVVGTPYYLSPQIIENKPYSFKSDIWSIGVVLYELCALQPPFLANSLQFLALKIVKGSYAPLQKNYTKELKQLVADMLQIDPSKRPSANEILRRPIIQQRIKKFLSETKQNHQFSHTVLHNQKVEIFSNRLVQKAQKSREKSKEISQIEKQRMRLKQQQEFLLQKRAEQRKREELQKKKQLQRKRELEGQKIQEERRKEEEARKRQEQRKRWMVQRQFESRKRQAEAYQKRRRKEEQEYEVKRRKEILMQERYEIQEKKKQEMEAAKRIKKIEEEKRKRDQLNEFARKQYFENMQIRKRAEERARQQETGGFHAPPTVNQQVDNYHYQQKRPVSKKQIRDNEYNIDLKKKNQSEFIRNEENKAPQSQLQGIFAQGYENDKKKEGNSKDKQSGREKESNIRKKHEESREQMKKDRELFMKKRNSVELFEDKDEHTIRAKKWEKRINNDDQSKEKDQNQVLQGKEKEPNSCERETKDSRLKKPSSWEKEGRSSRERSIEEDRKSNRDSLQKEEKQGCREKSTQNSNRGKQGQQGSGSSVFFIDEYDEQNFKKYLLELEGVLENVNKKIEIMENKEENRKQDKNIDRRQNKNQNQGIRQQKQDKQKVILPQMVQCQEIYYRDDGNDSLQLSLTDIPQEAISVQNTDLEYFSNYSKLETLKMEFENKFGTLPFINLYRILQTQIEMKGLQDFDPLITIESLGSQFNKNEVAENMNLLLTLVIMEQKLSAI